MTINQTVSINASPADVYAALMTSGIFGRATNGQAEIGPNEGDAFSLFEGKVTGRHIELVPGERIVQGWRIGMWPEGAYSIVTFSLSDENGGTTLSLVHSGYPSDMEEHLVPGWHKMYWDPLAAHFAK